MLFVLEGDPVVPVNDLKRNFGKSPGLRCSMEFPLKFVIGLEIPRDPGSPNVSG